MAHDDNEIREEHESFGLVQISRANCNPAMNVFGSSIKTGNPIYLRIKRVIKIRNLSSNWIHSKDRLIEIAMSPAQFADMITNLNSGSETPCTITSVGYVRMGNCPEVDQRQIFMDEFEKKTKDVAADLTELKSMIDSTLGAKGNIKASDKKKIIHKIMMVEQDVRANMPFVHTQFTRAMDKTTHEAKAEIEGFMTSTLINAGREAIASQQHVLEIESKKDS